MLRFIVRRLLVSIPLLIAASFLSFALTNAMGDPLGEWRIAKQRSASEIAAAEQRIGLDKPFLKRYGEWAAGFVKGDWGTTVIPGNSRQDVRERVVKAFWVTARLVLAAEILALLLGVGAGVLSAVRQYSVLDHAVTGTAFVMFSMPMFCLAVMIKYLAIDVTDVLEGFGVERWIRTAGPPPGGFHGSLLEQANQFASVYLLPTICLVLLQFAIYSRFQRASMLEVLNADYVRTAAAKGLSQFRVVTRHALRTALIPITTLFSLNFAGTIAGAVITETVFAWQGLGLLFVDAVSKKEPFMVLGIMMLTAVFVIVANLVADVMYGVLDPRIRLSE